MDFYRPDSNSENSFVAFCGRTRTPIVVLKVSLGGYMLSHRNIVLSKHSKNFLIESESIEEGYSHKIYEELFITANIIANTDNPESNSFDYRRNPSLTYLQNKRKNIKGSVESDCEICLNIWFENGETCRFCNR